MENNLKEILAKYNVKEEEFFPNVIRAAEIKSDSFPGLTFRQTKSMYREISNYYSSLNKTSKKRKTLGAYYEDEIQKDIIYKTEEPEVNQILDGGFKGGYTYKIIGPTQSGKTTLINSLIRNNLNNMDKKILYFSFIPDNLDIDILDKMKSSKNTNLTIVENIRNFNELLLSEYFQNKGEYLKNYDLVIFDNFTIILYKGIFYEQSLLNEFTDIINVLSWKNRICFVFGLYAKKLGNTFWYKKNEQENVERLILRNYESLDILQKVPNSVKIHLYKMQKYNVLKYYMKVNSSGLNNSANFIEWELNTK